MKNIKLKIRTLLIGTIVAVICSSFLATNLTYAVEDGAVEPSPASKGSPAKTTPSPAPTKKTPAKKKPKPAAPLPAATGIDTEAECKSEAGLSCADAKKAKDLEQKKLDAAKNNNNDLTEGTFSVTENLTLDDEEQAKKYFDKSSGQSPIVSFVTTIIDFAITIMGAIAVILFIVAGFMFMTANGNQTKLDEAKDIIKYAATGLIVALLSYVITIFVQSIFSNG